MAISYCKPQWQNSILRKANYSSNKLIVSGNTGYTVVVYSLYSTLKEKLPTTTLKNKNRTAKLPDQTITGPNG